MEQERKEELLSMTKKQLVDVIEMLEECMTPQQEKMKHLLEEKKSKFNIFNYFEEFYDHKYLISSRSKLKIENLINEYGMDKVVDAIKIAVSQYDYFESDKECFHNAISKLPGILYNIHIKKISSR
jgi:heterodisulfide reductase subunit B